MYTHWFVSRQKRQLTTLLPALIAFNDTCVGKKWSGNTELQLRFEDELQRLEITNHGSLRARKSKEGGGGIRTLMKQMQDLGLVFIEEESKNCQLTLIAEAMIKGQIPFTTAMSLQLQRYQYPSATSCSGSGAIEPRFRIHPFQFLMRLLTDSRLNGLLRTDEIAYIVIHQADTDSPTCLDRVVENILSYRHGNIAEMQKMKEKDKSKAFYNIANTLINYLAITQLIDKGPQSICVRWGKEQRAREFILDNPRFIPHPKLKENYIRAYGKGFAAKDLRDFSKRSLPSRKELEEARIRREYVLLSMQKPIAEINSSIAGEISQRTGLDEFMIERFLRKTFPRGNINNFFAAYQEYAAMGQQAAREFELATVEIFRAIFHMTAIHVGPLGNTPDVYVESDAEKFCGIIDNKAYKNGYSITGDHKRVMEDVYIPDVNKYGSGKYPLAFFSYIAGSFKPSINSQIQTIFKDTGVPGSAMPVDLFIRLAESCLKQQIPPEEVKRLFSLNREVLLVDLENSN